jgi:hypothetical protein
MLEADAAFADELGIHVHDDVVVLGVDDAESALSRQDLERLPDVAEVDHAPGARGQDVGCEDFQRGIAVLDRLRELARELRRRLGMQHDVVGPVARARSDEILVARLDGLEGGTALAPIGEIDQRGSAAMKRGAADLLGAGSDERRSVGLDPNMLEMHVRVDAARHDDASRGVDHALGGLRRERAGSGHRRNLLARNADVAFGHALGRHHVAALDDQFEHRPVPAI